MELAEAKKIIKNSGTTEAVNKVLNVQFEILHGKHQKLIKELQSQYDALNEIRNDFLNAENWEQLQQKIKEWNY